MKIGITIPYASTNYSGGINVQCRMWQQGLQALGHQTDLLNPWDKFDYNSYDYLFIVGCGKLLIDYVKLFGKFEKPKLVCAPILDPTMTINSYRLLCRYYGSIRFGFNTTFHDLYYCRNYFALFLVRSEYEKQYIIKGLGVPESKVKIVPISIRYDCAPIFNLDQKENFCLHVSRLATPGKNVSRLVEAAKKYDFKLKLAGTINGDKERKWLDDLLDGTNNVEYVGWLNEEDLIAEYRKAKVFALPSLIEGVGMVALEAASYGCEICLTNIGGPKEYYAGRAVLVDPYDIDSIGSGVVKALTAKKSQPELSQFLFEQYSLECCMKRLERILIELK